MLRFHLPSMACGGCARSVAKALAKADPAARINVDLTTRHVDIDTRLSSDSVCVVLAQAGFPAERELEGAS